MSDANFDPEELAEIKRLSERAQQVDRREIMKKVGRTLAFVVPAIGIFTVPRQALGQTGSGGFDGGGGAGNMGMGNMGMGNMNMGNMNMGMM